MTGFFVFVARGASGAGELLAVPWLPRERLHPAVWLAARLLAHSVARRYGTQAQGCAPHAPSRARILAPLLRRQNNTRWHTLPRVYSTRPDTMPPTDWTDPEELPGFGEEAGTGPDVDLDPNPDPDPDPDPAPATSPAANTPPHDQWRCTIVSAMRRTQLAALFKALIFYCDLSTDGYFAGNLYEDGSDEARGAFGTIVAFVVLAPLIVSVIDLTTRGRGGMGWRGVALNFSYTRMLYTTVQAFTAKDAVARKASVRAASNVKLLEALYESIPQLFIQMTVTLTFSSYGGGGGGDVTETILYASLVLSVLSTCTSTSEKLFQMFGVDPLTRPWAAAGIALYFAADAVSRAIAVALLYAHFGGHGLMAAASCTVVLDYAARQWAPWDAWAWKGGYGEDHSCCFEEDWSGPWGTCGAACRGADGETQFEQWACPCHLVCAVVDYGGDCDCTGYRGTDPTAAVEYQQERKKINEAFATACWNDILGSSLSLFTCLPLTTTRRDRVRLFSLSLALTYVGLAVGEAGLFHGGGGGGMSTALAVAVAATVLKTAMYAAVVHGLVPMQGRAIGAGGFGLFAVGTSEAGQFGTFGAAEWAQFFAAQPAGTGVDLRETGLAINWRALMTGLGRAGLPDGHLSLELPPSTFASFTADAWDSFIAVNHTIKTGGTWDLSTWDASNTYYEVRVPCHDALVAALAGLVRAGITSLDFRLHGTAYETFDAHDWAAYIQVVDKGEMGGVLDLSSTEPGGMNGPALMAELRRAGVAGLDLMVHYDVFRTFVTATSWESFFLIRGGESRVNLEAELRWLCDTDTDEKVLEALCAWLATDTTVMELDLADNHLTDSAGESIVAALRTNTSLQVLDLCNNNLTGVTVAALVASTALQTLNLSSQRSIADISGLAEALATNATLQSLSLRGNNLADAPGLPGALAANATLQTLDLSDNKLSKEAVAQLKRATAASSTLTDLNTRDQWEEDDEEEP